MKIWESTSPKFTPLWNSQGLLTSDFEVDLSASEYFIFKHNKIIPNLSELRSILF